MEDKQLQKNEFVREKIKDKPKNHKCLFVKICSAALSGVVFALAAILVLFMLFPLVEKRMEAEVVPGTIDSSLPQKETQTQSTESEAETQKETPVVKSEISLEDYQKIQTELYAIGNRANKSIVTITGVVSDTDWFNNSYEREGQGSGTIIGESGSKLLILTERKVIKGASKIKVTFIDDTVSPAEVMKYDGNTGLVVLAVSKLDLETSTLASISVMEMGSANTVHKGSVVIALGSPLGTNYSILTGNITATNNEISTADSNYSVYTTDIVANRNGSGILINTDGQLVGLVMQDYSASSASTLTAVDISELKPVMELLFADKDIPYLGVQASTVTDKIASTYRIPKGIYIKEVDMDSPAMNTGLQSGDVIVKLAGKDVTTVASYSEIVLGLEPGENYKIVIKREGSNGYKIITCEIKAGILK